MRDRGMIQGRRRCCPCRRGAAASPSPGQAQTSQGEELLCARLTPQPVWPRPRAAPRSTGIPFDPFLVDPHPWRWHPVPWAGDKVGIRPSLHWRGWEGFSSLSDAGISFPMCHKTEKQLQTPSAACGWWWQGWHLLKTSWERDFGELSW